MKWNLRMSAAQAGWKSTEMRRRWAEAGPQVRAGRMSALWTGTPTTIRLDDLEIINQALDITGIRHTRYRGITKTRLQHLISATALNLVRLHTWWTEHPLPTTRTSNLQRLDHALAA